MKKHLKRMVLVILFFSLMVPVGFTKTSSTPMLKEESAINIAASYHEANLYVQMGGKYQGGEYQTFTYQDKTYRYLSSSLNTHGKLLAYLTRSMTPEHAKQVIIEKNIIRYKGKLAQLEADGGSIADWKNATAFPQSQTATEAQFLMEVPLGDTGLTEWNIVTFKKQKGQWKIAETPELYLNIPGNVNPAFHFVTQLLVSEERVTVLFAESNDFDYANWVTGLTSFRYVDLKELSRTSENVTFAVLAEAELSSTYQGPLQQGRNYLIISVATGEEWNKFVITDLLVARP